VVHRFRTDRATAGETVSIAVSRDRSRDRRSVRAGAQELRERVQ